MVSPPDSLIARQLRNSVGSEFGTKPNLLLQHHEDGDERCRISVTNCLLAQSQNLSSAAPEISRRDRRTQFTQQTPTISVKKAVPKGEIIDGDTHDRDT
jgi:hypothetical protein